MALQMNYVDKEGDTHPNSYWVISDVKIFKRLVDNLKSPIAQEKLPDYIKWAGYYGEITIFGWRTKTERDNGKGARFVHSLNPTGWQPPENYHEITTSPEYRFTIDLNKNIYTSAYAYLKTLYVFKDAVDN
jgi:hypothetical protein